MARQKRRPKSGKELRRRGGFRREPDRILIVTEGSKTEPAYFKMLIAELGLTTAKVSIVGDGGSAPISVFEEAQRRLAEDDDFEQIYCVFDRDRHTTYDDALRSLDLLALDGAYRNKTIAAISSVPCFELWYFLHVSDSRKPYETASTGGSPAQALISELGQVDPFCGYKKNNCDDFFSKIATRRNLATERAVRFLSEAKAEGALPFHENPSTRVHILVEALVNVARKIDEEKSK